MPRKDAGTPSEDETPPMEAVPEGAVSTGQWAKQRRTWFAAQVDVLLLQQTAQL